MKFYSPLFVMAFTYDFQEFHSSDFARFFFSDVYHLVIMYSYAWIEMHTCTRSYIPSEIFVISICN